MRNSSKPRITVGRKAPLKAVLAGAAAAAAVLTVSPVASAAPSDGPRVVAGAPTASQTFTKGSPEAIARDMIDDPAEFQCFANIVQHESTWNHTAVNASSGAYGLVQALPANKMASAGSDWRTNPATQIEWGVDYMEDRYGSPCDAWNFWQSNNWY